MKKICQKLVYVFILCSLNSTVFSKVQWNEWSNDIFIQAQKENKFVLLDLEAIWCHWCHVMEAKTYSNDTVIEILEDRYIPVKVNQDARPDLANRYREYGWPATIIFAPDGSEIVKRAGYISPEAMARLLTVIIKDPSPERVSTVDLTETQFSNVITQSVKQKLKNAHRNSQDRLLGGLKLNQKYVERDSVEYALLGNKEEQRWANLTLTKGQNLLDPAWGGVYQYSTKGDWLYPHFEKLTTIQASYLRLYSLALAATGNNNYQKVIESIVNYSNNFLLDASGAFYTSQDADLIQGQHSREYFQLSDAERRQQGIPRIDKKMYARENGMMSEALATAYEVTGNQLLLDKALNSANWVIKNRSNKNGGFNHDKVDVAGPYLGDNLAMARAFLQLYRANANRIWLEKAIITGRFINQSFRHKGAGFLSSKPDGSPVEPIRQIDENISLARVSNLLFHYSGQAIFKDIAEHTMRFLSAEPVALSRSVESGILLAADELDSDPIHFTIKGPKQDKNAAKLYQTALRISSWYKRIEWWDDAEGSLLNNDVSYPKLDKAAAFICTNKLCSLPIYDPEQLKAQFNRMQSVTP